jgi:hypothetical protein
MDSHLHSVWSRGKVSVDGPVNKIEVARYN